jgi:excinuclease ABC subunit C
VNPKINNVDVFSIISDQTHAYVNFLELSHGAIIRSHTLEIKKQLEETDEQILEFSIVSLRERFNSISKEVILPFKVLLPEGLKATIPILGDKQKLLALSERNARFYRQDKLSQMRMVDPERHSKRIVAQIKEDLRLSELPVHIECFDNSNIQGSNPVAACVVFINAKPNKKMYRHFHIKTVEGPDDFASMEEVVYRRYKRLKEEGSSLPQLIVIDGGKGQLSAALKALDQLELRGKIAIVGIAKRLEEIYFPEDPIPLYLDKKSESLKVIQQLRNEAHRFGITFHRNLRSKGAIVSELDGIKGIGEKTATQLLRHFKTVANIKEANLDALIDQVGPAKARILYEHFH